MTGDTPMVIFFQAPRSAWKWNVTAGVFDENDNRTFEEEEFVEMLLALFRGMAAMLLGFHESAIHQLSHRIVAKK